VRRVRTLRLAGYAATAKETIVGFKIRVIAAATAIGCALASQVAWSDPADRGKLQQSMQQIFSSMRLLLPASVTRGGFDSEEDADQLRASLEQVARAAGGVGEHVRANERGAQYLSRSLEREAREALYLFDQGDFESAQFSVLQMAEYCVECHSRSAIPDDSPLSKGFVSSEVFQGLEPEERARLQFATREFEAGLDTLDALLVSRDVPAEELLGAVTNYLVVSLRLKQDFERARAALRKVTRRPDLWAYIRLDVDRWIESLTELQPLAEVSGAESLKRAVEVLDRAREVTRFPSDRQALVHYVVASALLQRFVETDASDADKARAYYLLGVVESRIGRSYWLALPYFFLESAIRLNPSGASARQAYALIEEETLFLYGFEEGAATPELPMDVEERLEALRALIDKAQPGKLPPRREVRDPS